MGQMDVTRSFEIGDKAFKLYLVREAKKRVISTNWYGCGEKRKPNPGKKVQLCLLSKVMISC